MENSQKTIKRVAVLTTADFISFIGGAEVAIKEVTKRLPGIQFDLYCARLTRDSKKEEISGNVRIRRIGFGSSLIDSYLLALFGAFIVGRRHKKENYDLIWSVMASYGGFASMFFKIKFPKVPFLLTLQEGDPVDHVFKRLGIFRQLFFKIFKKADAIQAISTYLAGWKSFGYRGELVRVIPNGVSSKDFENDFTNAEKILLRKELNIDLDSKIVITTSRLERKNGTDVLIKAFSLLKKKNPSRKITLLIVGQGSQMKMLKVLAEKEGISDSVRFVDIVQHQNIPLYLSLADVFARPSRSEGLGISFLEALSARVPIIGTSVGGIPDFLDDQETGLITLLDNPKDLSEKIEKLLTDEGLRKKVIENGKKMVEERYSWDKIAIDMDKMFEDTKKEAERKMLVGL